MGRCLTISMQTAPLHHLASILHPPHPLFSPQASPDDAASRSVACRVHTNRLERRMTVAARHDVDNGTREEHFDGEDAIESSRRAG